MDWTQRLASATNGTASSPDAGNPEATGGYGTDTPLPAPAAGQGSSDWISVLSGLAQKGVDAYTALANARSSAATAKLNAETTQANIALQKQRTEADTAAQQAQIQASLAQQLRSYGAQGVAAVQGAATNPTTLLILGVGALVAWKMLARR